ncbi:MAG TPA: RDD family protein [Burkholderiales bacterium]|nr:RDD family protein [Burkholderiales bacterium]
MDSGTRALPGPTVPGIGLRVLSMLYESLIVFAVAFFAGLAFYGATHGRLSGNTRLVFQLYLFLVLGAYFIACWSRGGRTLPMQTWKMRVVRPDNLPIGVGRAALRYVLAWPSLLLFGVGVFWAFFDRDRQFLHDRLAGTRVVATGDAGAGHR